MKCSKFMLDIKMNISINFSLLIFKLNFIYGVVHQNYGIKLLCRELTVLQNKSK